MLCSIRMISNEWVSVVSVFRGVLTAVPIAESFVAWWRARQRDKKLEQIVARLRESGDLDRQGLKIDKGWYDAIAFGRTAGLLKTWWESDVPRVGLKRD
jgi:biopolymer transport protein ExbB/TolQ